MRLSWCWCLSALLLFRCSPDFFSFMAVRKMHELLVEWDEFKVSSRRLSQEFFSVFCVLSSRSLARFLCFIILCICDADRRYASLWSRHYKQTAKAQAYIHWTYDSGLLLFVHLPLKKLEVIVNITPWLCHIESQQKIFMLDTNGYLKSKTLHNVLTFHRCYRFSRWITEFQLRLLNDGLIELATKFTR